MLEQPAFPQRLTNGLRLLTAILLGSNVGLGQPAPAPKKAASLTIQGSIRSRLEAWDWFQGDGNSSYAFLGTIARMSLGQNKGGFDWQVEFAAPLLLGLPDDSIGPGSQGQLGLGATYFAANSRSRNAGMVFVKQGFVRFSKLGGSEGHSIRVGRFEFSDGGEVVPKNATLAAIKVARINQRLIGPFGWPHVGRSLDGFHYVFNRPSANVTVVGAIPTRGVFQVDGWGQLHTAVLYTSLTKPLAATRYAGELRVLGMYYHDWRHVLKTDNRPVAVRQGDMGNIRIGSFGGHALNAFETAAGTVDLMLWGSVQAGRWGRLDQRAGAVAVEGGYQPAILPKLKPWLRGGFFHSTGDDDPLDSKQNSFFQFLPTPRPFARFPFFNMMNNQDLLGALILRPGKSVTVSGEVHALRLSARDDLWYLGGGAFQPWTFGFVGRPSNNARGLATLYDISTDYRVNPHLTLSGYFGHANGKSVISKIYPKGKNGSFGYLEVLYRF